MGFNFNFFGETEHRVFNYKPIYYDKEAEERRAFFGDDKRKDVSKDENGKPVYTPGQYLKGSFREGNYQELRKTSSVRTQKILGIVGLVLFFGILYYIVRFYGLITG